MCDKIFGYSYYLDSLSEKKAHKTKTLRDLFLLVFDENQS